MSEAKKPYIDDSNGRLYFNYPVGAELEFRTAAGKRFSVRIVGCEYEDGKEYYYVESAGKMLSARFSVEKLEKLIKAAPCEIVTAGELRELPLLVEEVERYYAERATERNYDNVEANRKLKGTEYGKLNTANGSLKKRLVLAEADGREADIAAVKAHAAGTCAENGDADKLVRRVGRKGY